MGCRDLATAVLNVCEKIRAQVFALAKRSGKSFDGLSIDDVEFSGGAIVVKKNPGLRVSIKEILQTLATGSIHEKSSDLLELLKHRGYSRNSQAAVFAEVQVDEDFGMVSVTRVVSAIGNAVFHATGKRVKSFPITPDKLL